MIKTFIKRTLRWYFTKNALPYWCMLLMDSSIYVAGEDCRSDAFGLCQSHFKLIRTQRPIKFNLCGFISPDDCVRNMMLWASRGWYRMSPLSVIAWRSFAVHCSIALSLLPWLLKPPGSMTPLSTFRFPFSVNPGRINQKRISDKRVRNQTGSEQHIQ